MYRQQNFLLSHWPGDPGTDENRFASLTHNPRYCTGTAVPWLFHNDGVVSHHSRPHLKNHTVVKQCILDYKSYKLPAAIDSQLVSSLLATQP